MCDVKKEQIKAIYKYILGVPAEKAGQAFATRFFCEKQKNSSNKFTLSVAVGLLSLTQNGIQFRVCDLDI